MRGVAEALRDQVHATPLLDLAIFLVALAGFVLFYGLERLVRGTRGRGPERKASDPPAGVFYLHLGSFTVYNALITYTMPLRLRTGILFALLFSMAMGLHFVLTDRGLGDNYPHRFRRWGRYVLAGGLMSGWVLAALLAPTNTLVVSLLTAFLAGSVLLTCLEELPSERRSSLGGSASGSWATPYCWGP